MSTPAYPADRAEAATIVLNVVDGIRTHRTSALAWTNTPSENWALMARCVPASRLHRIWRHLHENMDGEPNLRAIYGLIGTMDPAEAPIDQAEADATCAVLQKYEALYPMDHLVHQDKYWACIAITEYYVDRGVAWSHLVAYLRNPESHVRIFHHSKPTDIAAVMDHAQTQSSCRQRLATIIDVEKAPQMSDSIITEGAFLREFIKGSGTPTISAMSTAAVEYVRGHGELTTRDDFIKRECMRRYALWVSSGGPTDADKYGIYDDKAVAKRYGTVLANIFCTPSATARGLSDSMLQTLRSAISKTKVSPTEPAPAMAGIDPAPTVAAIESTVAAIESSVAANTAPVDATAEPSAATAAAAEARCQQLESRNRELAEEANQARISHPEHRLSTLEGEFKKVVQRIYALEREDYALRCEIKTLKQHMESLESRTATAEASAADAEARAAASKTTLDAVRDSLGATTTKMSGMDHFRAQYGAEL